MRWKEDGLKAEFDRAHPHIIGIAFYADHLCFKLFNKDLVVTDVERTQAEYDDIYHATPYLGPRPHLGPPSRAIDFRTLGELSDTEVQVLVDNLNAYWVRADGKPTAMHHGGTAQHLHVQSEA